ncbi:MAG: bifunctional diaminohydroxyphosphoribosylaminopyrimidine deaminase/5-amino-6-(5-phosphoribosylamino)uracil reductase RibD [Rhodothermaceae bacterium]|nr:bifunctional diaminohydroxyphosphoribosylaminopyrimidine deaminase/5-amino-6-(5-phosphoribosylamino)uracil reductase RibD [Rhodothermaceae bacterium]
MAPARFTDQDRSFMKKALRLAAKGAGYVSPNPMVGCIIVSADGKVIGKGYHERFGKAHAEINALNSVRDHAALVGATLYVTLEPCSHQGKTPPCAVALSKLPLKRVVTAMVDPNPAVSGRGLKILEQAGIQTETGLLEEEAVKLNEAFIHYIRYNKPFVTLKIAQTLDGYIAAPDGNSEWISGEESRRLVHEWRSRYDAVLVGRNTALLDNPRLTVRLTEGRQPRRIVIDGPLSLPRNLNLFSDQFEEKTVVITYNREKYNETADPMLKMLQPDYFRGETHLVARLNGHCDLDHAFDLLAESGISSILVEGGRDLSSALIGGNMVDKIHVFIAPKLLGGGTRSVMNLGIDRMQEVMNLHNTGRPPWAC